VVVTTVGVRSVPDVGELMALGRAAGLAAVGVASAGRFESTRRDLEERKARGLHGGMAFTYRNPARSTEPERALAGAQALVVGAWSYLRADVGEASPRQGVVARYAWDDYYAQLRGALQQVARRLVDGGWKARVLADDNALVDRAAAQRAGLGWYGKNANLLLPGQGSWFVLGSVVTDAPLATTGPDDQVPDGCGTCTRCLDGCPTGAIIAPGVVDARRCLAWLLQADGPFSRDHRIALGNRIYGCDDCQEVCPPNRRAQRLLEPAPVPRSIGRASGARTDGLEAAPVPRSIGRASGARTDGLEAAPVPRSIGRASGARTDGVEAASGGSAGARVDLVELLGLSDEELLARFGRWYIPRREPRYLRRNALVVLGNIGEANDHKVAEALRRALMDSDPLVRAHAVWAARRMGRDDLLATVADDPDPLVQDELRADVEVRSS
jgi:epoxyqueuosine reductase